MTVSLLPLRQEIATTGQEFWQDAYLQQNTPEDVIAMKRRIFNRFFSVQLNGRRLDRSHNHCIFIRYYHRESHVKLDFIGQLFFSTTVD